MSPQGTNSRTGTRTTNTVLTGLVLLFPIALVIIFAIPGIRNNLITISVVLAALVALLLVGVVSFRVGKTIVSALYKNSLRFLFTRILQSLTGGSQEQY